jgi:hypothetical protein
MRFNKKAFRNTGLITAFSVTAVTSVACSGFWQTSIPRHSRGITKKKLPYYSAVVTAPVWAEVTTLA